MSATVRSPSGQFYVYNNCHFLDRPVGRRFIDLRTKQGGDLLAQVPDSWLVEYVAPCVIGSQPANAKSALELLLNNNGQALRSMSVWELRRLKTMLKNVNVSTGRWKR